MNACISFLNRFANEYSKELCYLVQYILQNQWTNIGIFTNQYGKESLYLFSLIFNEGI